MEFKSLQDFPAGPDLPEEGTTFEENAVKKAQAVARYTGLWALADDSGLEVDALPGELGVRSSRWEGVDTPYEVKNARLLARLRGVPPEGRRARYRCVVALASPGGRVLTAEGVCEGRIAMEPRGHYGFGYDPIFYLPEYGRTMAELRPEEKNRLSHRARALAALGERLAAELEALYQNHAHLQQDELMATRRECLRAQKSALLSLLQQGVISEEVYRDLVTGLDRQLETLDKWVSSQLDITYTAGATGESLPSPAGEQTIGAKRTDSAQVNAKQGD